MEKMREILFRGKKINNGEWFYGSLIKWSHFNGKGYEDVFSIKNVYSHEYLIDSETIGQFTGLTDKNGTKIFEGDKVRFRTPYRTTQTLTGTNIPNGSYTESMEPGIIEYIGVVQFKNGSFIIENHDDDPDFPSPISWHVQNWDLESIKEAISWTKQTPGWFYDPEEGDLQYLIKEVAKVENEQQLIDYLSGIEIIGNIHDNPELL